MVKKSVDLPEELIIEILLRSTVKTVLRCKCVCKLWFSIISHPDFATSHFQLAASPTRKLVCLGNNSEALSIHFDAPLNHNSSYASLCSAFLRHESRFKIRGSCKGFLFLHCGKYWYVWNPSTGVQKQIPASPISIASEGYVLCGFGYNHSTNDYLIVLVSFTSSWVSSSIDLEIFSLRDNKWKQIDVGSHFPYRTTFNSVDEPIPGLLLNEAIHWIVYKHETGEDVIISFDLKEMTMLEIAMPDDFRATRLLNDYLDGLISAWTVEMNIVKIWVMQKYAVHSSWTKIFEFSADLISLYSLSIVCFTNCGDIIGTNGRGGLVKFNDKGQLLEHRFSYKNIYLKRRFQMAVYTESLLSLPFGTEQVLLDD